MFFIFLSSCIDPVNLDYRREKGILVVDGLITDEPPPYSISLSYTGDFESARRPTDETVVTGAKVEVNDDAGGVVEFFQDPQKGGVYITRDTSYVGVPGRTYTLKITLADGRKYTSLPEKMEPVPSIDSLTAAFSDIINVSTPDGFRIFVDLPEIKGKNTYYRWSSLSYCRTTRCWVREYNRDIAILDDINGNSIRRQEVYFSPVYTIGKNYVEVAQHSLTKEAFQFWKLFKEQRNRTGSILDPVPSPVEGNIFNVENPEDIALGYFGASSVKRKRITLEFYDMHKISSYQGRFDVSENCITLPSNWQ